jgi:hypothetical protein
VIRSWFKYVLLFIAVIFTEQNSFAQKDSLFKLIKTINYPCVSFSVNNLGEIYLIGTDNQLKKLNEKGDSVGVFNEVTKYGKLTYIDAQNPWRTLLYYQNFFNLVLLDKYLNVVGSIKLPQRNIFRAKAISTSYDNNIWVYDEQEYKLKKIDESGTKLSETTDFRMLFDSVFTPAQILDHDGFVYLYDPAKGLYSFDYYGLFKNKLTFLGWKDIDIVGKTIYGFDDKYFYRYSLGSLDLQQFPLPDYFKYGSSIKVGNNRIYVLKDNIINIYSPK